MCGIFGFAKKGESQSDFHIEKIKEMTKHLSEASVIRGSDSTGFAIISPRFNNIWKSTLSSPELVAHGDWDTIMGSVDRGTTALSNIWSNRQVWYKRGIRETERRLCSYLCKRQPLRGILS